MWDNWNLHRLGSKSCKKDGNDKRDGTEARPMTIPAFETDAPDAERITAYDKRHFVTYLRLLDATEEGADWCEIVQVLFGLDASCDPQRARTVYDSHLTRARWMTTHGYRHLLEMSRKQ